eukprot:gene2502-2541_t
MHDKAFYRNQALSRRDALDDAQRAVASAKIADFVMALSAGFPRGPVSLFWPIRSEIDTRPLMAALQRAGFDLVLPRVEGSSLEFRLWQKETPLVIGKFGLSEPDLDAPLARPATMLIPLAAFDRAGHRIGYGKGFYDRAIAALNPKRKIGLAFACQEIAQVPFEGHDERLDEIVTEEGVIVPSP